MLATRFFTSMTRLSGQAVQQMTRSRLCINNRTETDAVRTLVDDKIRGRKIMVFSKSYCPFCQKAKDVFEQLIEENKLHRKDYEVLEIEDDPNCDAIQDYLGKLTGARSVPRVFINQQSLGGGNEVAEAYSDGKLIKLIS